MISICGVRNALRSDDTNRMFSRRCGIVAPVYDNNTRTLRGRLVYSPIVLIDETFEQQHKFNGQFILNSFPTFVRQTAREMDFGFYRNITVVKRIGSGSSIRGRERTIFYSLDVCGLFAYDVRV